MTRKYLYSSFIRGGLTVGLVGLMALAGCAKGKPGTNSNDNGNTIPDAGAATLPLGDSCAWSWECLSELCLGVGQTLLCSQNCETDPCPGEFYCAYVDVQIAPTGEEVPPAGYYCLPDRGGLCKPCGSDINCTFAGDRCLDLGNGAKVCGRDCQHAGFCPVGYECRQGQCWPILNTCDCIPERIGATRVCQEMNEFGVCQGTQTCDASGWDACSAGIPSFEVCNGLDDDCDGSLPTDELDGNDNGTIDCLDGCVPSAETCDAMDNDCNGVVDDGDPATMCGGAANGNVICLHGECTIGSCNSGYVDLDEEVANGCECQLDTSGGETCSLPETVPPLSDAEPGTTELRTGILQETEERWYYVQAIDEPDVGSGQCDNFHFRVRFTANPADVYLMDVLAEHCTGADECEPQGVVDFQRYRNYYYDSDDIPDNQPPAEGECPCGDPPGPNENACTDNSAVYLIRIYRQPGIPLTCDPFELEFTNGVYPAPI